MAIIISFTVTASVGSQSESNFSMFDDAYISIKSYETLSSSSYGSLSDSYDDHAGYDWHNDSIDEEHEEYDWHKDSFDDDHGAYYRHNESSGGDYAAAAGPEPVSSTLFIIGGATLGFRQWRKKKTV